MKFGHAEPEHLNGLTFELPPDHTDSLIQKSQKAHDSFRVYTGCGKWGIKEWIGPIYPKGTKQKNFLSAYLQTFGSIELNGTFYRLSRTSIENWKAAAEGTDFLFCPKWSQRISHFKRLNEVEENTEYFMQSMALLGDHLGQTFLTLPPNFGVKHMQRVKDFLELVPPGYPLQMEFRHKEWFEEAHFAELVGVLKAQQIGLVITDVALRRDVLHMCLTSPVAFVRFNGYGLHETDYTRLDAWVERLLEWRQNGLKSVYFFMHQQNETHTPYLASYLAERLRKSGGIDVHAPKLPQSDG